MTAKPGLLFAHIFDRPADGILRLPPLPKPVRRAFLLEQPGEDLTWYESADGVGVDLSTSGAGPGHRLIRIEIDLLVE